MSEDSKDQQRPAFKDMHGENSPSCRQFSSETPPGAYFNAYAHGPASPPLPNTRANL